MNSRGFAPRLDLFAVIVLGALVAGPVPASAQTAEGWSPSLTPWGDPDLQGTWTNTTTTPLERPEDLADQAVFTPEEFAARNAQVAEEVSLDNRPRNQTGAYNEFWMERGALNLSTSLVIDPANGRLPALTPTEVQRRADHAADRAAHSTDSHLYRSAYDRCISRGLPGSMMPGFYNHNYQILQTPDNVVVLVEMIHDARIIPLDRRPHVDSHIKQWLGDSRGWWEGDTLVVETTNLTSKAGDRIRTTFGAGRHTTVVERFTRTGEGSIDYRITVTDPTEYRTPWTAVIPMTTLGGQLYEYACHEGNYAIANILSGARAEERAEEPATH